MVTLVLNLESAKMLNVIRVSVFAVILSGVADAQGPSPASPDSAATMPPYPSSAGITVKQDTSLTASGYGAARRPMPVMPEPVPDEGSFLCRGVKRWECAAYGALFGAVAGGWAGSAFAAQPKYEESGGILSSLVCVENCGTQKIELYLSLSGGILGGIVGWHIGRK